MNTCFVAMLVGHLLLTGDKPGKAALADKSELEGEWELVVCDSDSFWLTAVDGPIGDHYRDLRFIFTRDRMKITLRENGQQIWMGLDGIDDPYKTDPSKSPKEIDVKDFGRGIYNLKRGRLFMCLARRQDAKRPTAFELTAKEGDTLLLLERVKK
jgi:uncharacterized protein (TIGR03067 family)